MTTKYDIIDTDIYELNVSVYKCRKELNNERLTQKSHANAA